MDYINHFCIFRARYITHMHFIQVPGAFKIPYNLFGKCVQSISHDKYAYEYLVFVLYYSVLCYMYLYLLLNLLMFNRRRISDQMEEASMTLDK